MSWERVSSRSCVIGPFGVRRGLDWGGSCEGPGVFASFGGRWRDALVPGRRGRGVQEDQRVPPALEGGVVAPAGAAALATLVNLPARPRVPAPSGPAGPHDSPGSVRRAVLAGAVVVLVVGDQLQSCPPFRRSRPPATGGAGGAGGAGPRAARFGLGSRVRLRCAVQLRSAPPRRDACRGRSVGAARP